MSSRSPEPWTADRLRDAGLHISVETAADVLGIGRSTAYDLIRRGEFPVRVIRIGRQIRVPTESILELLGA